MVIDNKPIRRKAVAKCKNILKNFYALKQEINYFETEDNPAYKKWINSNFGVEITQLRELAEQEKKLEEFIYLVQEFKYYKNLSYHKAYNLIIELQKEPEKLEEELEKLQKKRFRISQAFNDFNDTGYDFSDGIDDDDDFDDDFEDEELSIDELETLFKAMLVDFGIEKEVMKDRDVYAAMFREFVEVHSPGYFSDLDDDFYNDDDNLDDSENESDDYNVDYETRLKSIYRELAFKLHPDNSEQKDITRELWYQVQEAYQNKNLDDLVKIKALHGYHEGGFSEEHSVSDILELHKEHKSELRFLRQVLGDCKEQAAWNFKKRKDKGKLKKSILRQFNAEINYQKQEIDSYQRTIDKWKTPPKSRKSKTIIKTQQEANLPKQQELPF